MTRSISVRSGRTTEPKRDASERARATAEETTAGSGAPPLLARLVFGAVAAFMGMNHFRDTEAMIGYAESKGVPMADLVVPFSGGMLIFGGIGVTLWRFPRLAAGAIATFLIGTTPTMHDFWNQEGEEKQSEMINFLKNLGLLAAAVSFIDRASR